MRAKFLFISILLLLFSCEASIEIVPSSSGGNSDNSRNNQEQGAGLPNIAVNAYEKEIFKLVNNHRAKYGKNSLKWHTQATIESQDHSQDMAAYRVPFGHLGFSERIIRIKAKEAEANSIIASAENVAQNSTAPRAFQAWLNSSGHRRNIEGNYTHTGIGAIKSANGSWYFTQIFLRK